MGGAKTVRLGMENEKNAENRGRKNNEGEEEITEEVLNKDK